MPVESNLHLDELDNEVAASTGFLWNQLIYDGNFTSESSLWKYNPESLQIQDNKLSTINPVKTNTFSCSINVSDSHALIYHYAITTDGPCRIRIKDTSRHVWSDKTFDSALDNEVVTGYVINNFNKVTSMVFIISASNPINFSITNICVHDITLYYKLVDTSISPSDDSYANQLVLPLINDWYSDPDIYYEYNEGEIQSPIESPKEDKSEEVTIDKPPDETPATPEVEVTEIPDEPEVVEVADTTEELHEPEVVEESIDTSNPEDSESPEEIIDSTDTSSSLSEPMVVRRSVEDVIKSFNIDDRITTTPNRGSEDDEPPLVQFRYGTPVTTTEPFSPELLPGAFTLDSDTLALYRDTDISREQIKDPLKLSLTGGTLTGNLEVQSGGVTTSFIEASTGVVRSKFIEITGDIHLDETSDTYIVQDVNGRLRARTKPEIIQDLDIVTSSELGDLAYKDSASTSYTPQGSVSAPTATYTTSTVSAVTNVIPGRLPSYTVDDGVLTLDAGTQLQTESADVVLSITSIKVGQPTFTGTTATITVT